MRDSPSVVDKNTSEYTRIYGFGLPSTIDEMLNNEKMNLRWFGNLISMKVQIFK